MMAGNDPIFQALEEFAGDVYDLGDGRHSAQIHRMLRTMLSDYRKKPEMVLRALQIDEDAEPSQKEIRSALRNFVEGSGSNPAGRRMLQVIDEVEANAYDADVLSAVDAAELEDADLEQLTLLDEYDQESTAVDEFGDPRVNPRVGEALDAPLDYAFDDARQFEPNPVGDIEATDRFMEVDGEYVRVPDAAQMMGGGAVAGGVSGERPQTYSFEEMVMRRQGAQDWAEGEEEIIEHPDSTDIIEQTTTVEEDPSGGLNSRMLGAAIVGGTGLVAGLAQPFVDQYMQRDWENMLRASADGDTVARKEGALAAGRAMQGMMGASLGRRDISPALAMRNAQNVSRNILQDIYGRQLVASAQERRIAEQQLAKIRSDRWQKALGTLTQVGADVGAFLGKEGAKQSAGPVTAGMKNSGEGGGDATGQ